ncbi:hypothetical protein ZIOFF_045304 [Zingiber officinale]|uniref:Uncharacterized protein n=1 Tax=Zingiber officinale TaxID=94328 RepID=A0A8J5FWZ6_ZINOF|nr:hypothetical protein ZIOFF_045304 [Zingiber officinale]
MRKGKKLVAKREGKETRDGGKGEKEGKEACGGGGSVVKERRLGDASEAVNVANGHMVCGCDNVAYCRNAEMYSDIVSDKLKRWVNVCSDILY